MTAPLQGLSETLQTTFVLVFFALPLSVLLGGVVFVPWSRRYWSLAHATRILARHGWVLAGLVLMLVPEVMESQVDPYLSSWVPDATPLVAWLDGGGELHVRLQQALPWAWTQSLFSAVYVGGYPFLIIFTVALGIWLDKGPFARRALGAYALCYAIALPFYLFFPVNEVWHHTALHPDGPAVRNIALQYAFVKEHLYSFNAINNCFPSLHTGIAVAMAGVARRGPSRAYWRLTSVLATLIVFSTLYLGIHWSLDVLAGLALAWVVVRQVHRWWPDPAEASSVPTEAPTAAA